MKPLIFFIVFAVKLWSGTITYDPHRLVFVEGTDKNYPGLKDRDITIIEVCHELESTLKDQFEQAIIKNNEIKIKFSGNNIFIDKEQDLPTRIGISHRTPDEQNLFIHHGDIKYNKSWLFGENKIVYRLYNGWKNVEINDHSLFSSMIQQIRYAKRLKRGLLINQEMLKKAYQPYAVGLKVLQIAEPFYDHEEVLSPARLEIAAGISATDPYHVHLRVDEASINIFTYYMYQRIKKARQNNLYVIVDEAILNNAKTFEEIDAGISITHDDIEGNWRTLSYKDIAMVKREMVYRFEFKLGEQNFYIPLRYSRIKNLVSSFVSYAKKEKLNLAVNLSALSSIKKQKYLHFKHVMKVEQSGVNNEDMVVFFQ